MPAVLGIGVAILVVTMLSIRIAAFTGFIDSSDKPRVLVLGDSISDRGQVALQAELSGPYRVSVDGKASFTAAMQEPSAERWATRDFRQVVINLGTNDLVRGESPTETAATLERIVALYPGALCIHLVTVNEDMPVSTAPNIQSGAVALNSSISDLARTNPQLRVVDWARIVDAEIAEGVDVTLDGVHPRQEGQELLAAAIAESLAGCEPATSA